MVSGIGFKDIAVMDDMAMINQIENGDISSEAAWKIYITYQIIYSLFLKYNQVPGFQCRRVLQKTKSLKDKRLLSRLSAFFEKYIGDTPRIEQLDFRNLSINISKNNSISIYELLNETNAFLEENKKTTWFLIDKADELFSQNINARKSCIEGLFFAYFDFVARFPFIKIKIFLRTDIWSTLSFVNKSHITDKTTTITWEQDSLRDLLLKRVCNDATTNIFLIKKTNITNWTKDSEVYFNTIFPEKVYPGEKEAKTLSWMIARVTDGLKGVYPREIINFSNISVSEELDSGESLEDDAHSVTSLISGNSIRKAFSKVSKIKVESYLSEFPHLQKHFDRFSGQQKADYTQNEFLELMNGLIPSGEEMIKQLHETGVILYSDGVLTPNTNLSVPRLFRQGLGIVTQGRP